MHPARLDLKEFEQTLEFEYARASGPGGQHRNKVETAVRVTHCPTGLRSHASERRSMSQNKSKAVKRVRMKVALEYREALDPEQFVSPGVYAPSPLWESRRQGSKMICSAEHTDYPALIAEALDVLQHCMDEISKAAGVLGTSTAQLVKFFGREPAALARVNDRRRKRGLRPLN